MFSLRKVYKEKKENNTTFDNTLNANLISSSEYTQLYILDTLDIHSAHHI